MSVIINTKSGIRKLRTAAGIGIIAAGLFGSYKIGPTVWKSMRASGVEHIIEQQLSHLNYEQAQQLVQEYQSIIDQKKKTMYEQQISNAMTVIKKQREKVDRLTKITKQIDAAIEKGDETAANTLLTEYATLVDEKTLMEAKERLRQNTPQGLYEKTITARGTALVDICEKYLNRYPQGDHAMLMKKTLLVAEVGVLDDYLRDLAPFTQVRLHLKKAIGDATKYGVRAPGLITKSTNDVVESYIRQYTEAIDKEQYNPGDAVIVKSLDGDFKQEYLAERNTWASKGNRGIVKAIADETKITIQLPDNITVSWNTQWGE